MSKAVLFIILTKIHTYIQQCCKVSQ